MFSNKRRWLSDKKGAACPRLLLCLVAGIFLTPTSVEMPAAAQATKADQVTRANWQKHPKIQAVRTIVASVNAGLSKKTLKVSVRKFDYCEPYEDSLRRKAVDSKGLVRMYETQAGSDDSSLTWQHFYDEAGRLRFVLITGGATNGAQLEHRIYLDEDGKRIWEEHKYKRGPEYTFPEVWPDDQLQTKNPADAFAGKSRCWELKAKGR